MFNGFVYLVCPVSLDNIINLKHCKIGFTTSIHLEDFVHKNYSHSFAKINIFDYIPSLNPRENENTIHMALAKYRIDPNHEVFDISSSHAQQIITLTKKYLQSIENTHQLSIRPINYQFWKVLKDVKKNPTLIKKIVLDNKIVDTFYHVLYFKNYVLEDEYSGDSITDSLDFFFKMVDGKNFVLSTKKKILTMTLDSESIVFINFPEKDASLNNIKKFQNFQSRNNTTPVLINNIVLDTKPIAKKIVCTIKKTTPVLTNNNVLINNNVLDTIQMLVDFQSHYNINENILKVFDSIKQKIISDDISETDFKILLGKKLLFSDDLFVLFKKYLMSFSFSIDKIDNFFFFKQILDKFIYKTTDEKGYVSKKEMKEILKENKIKINDIDLIRTIEVLYGCQYYSDTSFNGISIKRVFKKINI
jgi:hypothetical protein